MAELEYGGIKASGSKLLLIIPLLGTIGGGLWGGFEFYKDYMDMKEIIQEIDIDEIKVTENPEHIKQIKLDDKLMMEMRYPSLDQFIKNNFDVNDSSFDQSFELIASCVDKIYSEEEVWSTDDVSKKEVMDFLEQMNSIQFKDIEKFFETMPKLSHTLNVTNPKTKVESEVVLEGLSSFFA